MCRCMFLCLRLLFSLKMCVCSLMCGCVVLLVICILFSNRQIIPPWRSTHTPERNYTEGFKYILLWAHTDWAPFTNFIEPDVFTRNNCSFTNCYVTDNRDYFDGNLTRFHAIAFNGRIEGEDLSRVPRDLHQKFIYVNTESSANFAIGHSRYDGFFNWTATYRLDSDIPYPYILIRDSTGNIVGPNRDLYWVENMTEANENLIRGLEKKKKYKAAVTFISHCNAKSKRDSYIFKLKKGLLAHGFSLDIYGKCGNKECPIGSPVCDSLVEEYYFYLAFENSFAEDYVTEKLLRAVNHDTVPVVFGGADYSRFLPPGTYLNAREYTPDELAGIMIDLIKSPKKYQQYFKWKNYYTYHNPMAKENVCTLCEVLNNGAKYNTTSVYQDLGAWWNH